MVLWHVVYQAQISLATGVLEETWSRSVLNLLVTPMKEWEYVAGVALFGLVKLVAGVGTVALIAWGAYAFDITTVGVGLVPITALLLVIGWAIALFVVGMVLRFGNGAEAFAWGVLFVVMPLSGVFYPVSSLPAVLRPIGQVLPTTHAFAAGRAFATGQPTPVARAGAGHRRHRRGARDRAGLPGLDAAHLPHPRLRDPLLLSGPVHLLPGRMPSGGQGTA